MSLDTFFLAQDGLELKVKKGLAIYTLWAAGDLCQALAKLNSLCGPA
jgi:hypothetical protein